MPFETPDLLFGLAPVALAILAGLGVRFFYRRGKELGEP